MESYLVTVEVPVSASDAGQATIMVNNALSNFWVGGGTVRAKVVAVQRAERVERVVMVREARDATSP